MTVLTYPALLLMGSGNTALVIVGFLLALSLCQSLTFGPMAAFVSEQFGTKSRYTRSVRECGQGSFGSDVSLPQ